MALTYQWYKDGSPIGGATSATYSKPSAVEGDAGSYYCRVTNAFGSINSNAAIVTVDANTLLLVQVDSAGNIVERTGKTIATTGNIYIDYANTHDGYGSIRDTAVGETAYSSGHVTVSNCGISLNGDFTIEFWLKVLGNWDSFYYLFSSLETILLRNNYTRSFFAAGGGSVSFGKIQEQHGYVHVAAVRHNGSTNVYLNGGGSTPNSSIVGTIDIDDLIIGDNGYSHSPGCWENIRVSNIARYTANFTPPGRF